MAIAGRKNKYETLVKPKFDEIKKLVDSGATDKEIITFLGINKSTFYDYINQFSDFSDLMRSNRMEKVEILKNTLFKKACGFQYEEKKESINANGENSTEVFTKTCLPSETAMLILLKHWDKNEDGSTKWMNDPATFELKKEELKFRKEKLEEEKW